MITASSILKRRLEESDSRLVNNNLLRFAQTMQQQRPEIIQGGGFLKNLVTHAMPGVLGSLSNYMGQQRVNEQMQRRSDLISEAMGLKGDERREALNRAVPNLGNELGLQEQALEQEQARKIALDLAEKQNTENVSGRLDRELDRDKLDQKAKTDLANISLRSAELNESRRSHRALEGLRGESNRLQRQRNKLDGQMAGLEQKRQVLDKELDLNKQAKSLEQVKALNEAIPHAAKAIATLESNTSSREAFDAGLKNVGRVISPEAFMTDDRLAHARARGFEGEVKEGLNWWANRARTDVAARKELANVLNLQMKGLRSAATAARDNFRSGLTRMPEVYPGLNLENVGRLPEAVAVDLSKIVDQSVNNSSPEYEYATVDGVRVKRLKR